MSPTNREIQLQKNCQLYRFVLHSLHKEVPYAIEECAHSYEYPVDCSKELAALLSQLDAATLNDLMSTPDCVEAYHLRQWWEMYQSYIPIEK